MRLSKLIEQTHKSNMRGWAGPSSHTVIVNTSEYPISIDEARFEQDDYPYLRLSLLDMYIEQVLEEAESA